MKMLNGMIRSGVIFNTKNNLKPISYIQAIK